VNETGHDADLALTLEVCVRMDAHED
jgi:hypothetical protein